MRNGEATFDKLQINDVTSHFKNGWVFLVVSPSSCNNNLDEFEGDE